MSLLATSVLIMSACSADPEPIGKFENMKIVSKKGTDQCYRGCANEYYVTLEKNGEKITLEIPTESMFKTIKKGNTVTVDYDENYMVVKLTFTKIESKK